jgi:hypothetical protein
VVNNPRISGMRWNKPYRSAHSRHRTEQSTACCQRNHTRQTLVGRNDQASALRSFSLIEKSLTGSGTVSHQEVTIRLLLHVTLTARRNARISPIPRSPRHYVRRSPNADCPVVRQELRNQLGGHYFLVKREYQASSMRSVLCSGRGAVVEETDGVPK